MEDIPWEGSWRTGEPRSQLSLKEGYLIEQFTAVRQETIRIVRTMKGEDLDLKGMHAFHGKGNLGRFTRWEYEHARIHEDDIRKALGKTHA